MSVISVELQFTRAFQFTSYSILGKTTPQKSTCSFHLFIPIAKSPWGSNSMIMFTWKLLPYFRSKEAHMPKTSSVFSRYIVNEARKKYDLSHPIQPSNYKPVSQQLALGKIIYQRDTLLRMYLTVKHLAPFLNKSPPYKCSLPPPKMLQNFSTNVPFAQNSVTQESCLSSLPLSSFPIQTHNLQPWGH